MTLKESIRFHTEEAEKMKLHRKVNELILGTEAYERELQEHTQLAEWLRELHERRSADAVKAESPSKIDAFCSNCRNVKAESPSKIDAFCSNCRNEAPEGKINSDCLMCMHLYGVHTQEANKEAAYESINFPKRDLFEPKKG